MTYERSLKKTLQLATQDSPIILLVGARQTGKSTLVRELTLNPQGGIVPYVTLDDLTVLGAARSRPVDFVEGLPEYVVIDEVQRAPEIFLPIKKSVDENRKAGRFILTGSANVLTLPTIADSLAGRMEIHELWPLSQSEIEVAKTDFISGCFSTERTYNVKVTTKQDLIKRIVLGGYPEVITRVALARRNAWFKSYLQSLIQRDIRELSKIEGIKELPSLLSLIASRAGGLVNASELSRSLTLSNTTLRRYMALLEGIYLTTILPAWSNNRGKRVVKAPKIYLNDTGLLCHLLGLDEKALALPNSPIGSVMENFVVMELRKNASWSASPVKLWHYRTVSGQEVDVIIEHANGSLVGVEIKSTSSINEKAFSGLKAFKQEVGDKFVRGIVLYTGQLSVAFASDMQAVPITALWS
jgi:uncharacterized protein